jgi:hypothetical protein
MPRQGHLKGYRRLPGSARAYLTPSGRKISRYEYDSRRARAAGFANRGEVERARARSGWSAWRFKIRAEDPSAQPGFTSPEFRAAVDLSDMRDAGEPESAVNDPNGPLAALLVATGRRDPDWTWAVGDTPKGAKA